jgi:hypothetical protein
MRILLIAPVFYDYHSRIVEELTKQGHEVVFFAERPSRWIYSPAKKLPSALRRSVFSLYMKRILNSAAGQFDRVVVIRGEILEEWFIDALRSAQPKARFTLYEWDSLRVVNYRKLLPKFDAAATFDSVDAQTLGLPYLPLFYVPAYRLGHTGAVPQNDLVFVGSYHEARYKTLNDIRCHCERQGIRLATYLYISLVDYLKLVLRGRAPAKKDVFFQKLDQPGVLALYENANSILDIENAKQAGLTMRTFEALATGRNLVTTNALASELLPTLAHRIVVVDRAELNLCADRIRHMPGPGTELDPYSLRAWVNNLLLL